MKKISVLALPRSGTTSLSSIFSNHCSQNEYLETESVRILSTSRLNHSFPKSIVAELVNRRWSESGMNLDAASFNFMCPDIIAQLYSHMNYIFLLRDPIDWIESFCCMLNYYIALFEISNMPDWMLSYGYVFSPNFTWEGILELISNPTSDSSNQLLKDFLDFWITENSQLLSFSLSNTVLYLETSSISSSLNQLSKFAGVPVHSLSTSTHVNKGKLRRSFLSTSQKAFVSHMTSDVVMSFRERANVFSL